MQQVSRAAAALLAAAALASARVEAAAQVPDTSDWDAAVVLDVLERARDRRVEVRADTALRSYVAEARGHVYFYLENRETEDRSLVRTDQVALELYWQAPDRVRQQVVGWRHRSELPERIHYYLDRMTVVHDDFGESIVIADGENVRDVPHPLATGAQTVYQFRLAGATRIRLGGSPEPITVRRVEVRPRDPSRPAAVGTLFLDDATGALVRMDVTFTRASYVERRLDYINVSLENALWRGRFWLPHEQRMEIRREIPELDFPIGTVIRTRMRISGYRLNEEIPPAVFMGPAVTFAPRAVRERFPFETPLDGELREEGIGPAPDLEAIRRQARGLLTQRAISGLPAARLRTGAVSSLFRYNRAEGPVITPGASVLVEPLGTLRLRGGAALGVPHPLLRAELVSAGRSGLSAAAYVNEARDVGHRPVVSGAINTLSSLAFAADYTDLFHASGVEAGVAIGGAPWPLAARVRAERHRSAALTGDLAFAGGGFRPVLPVDDGTWVGGEMTAGRLAPAGAPPGWSAAARVEGGVLDAERGTLRFGRAHAEAAHVRAWAAADARLELDLEAGAATGTLPRQHLFLLGGRGTIPGFAFRSFAGDRFARAEAVVSAEAVRPWLRARGRFAAGASGVGGVGAAAAEAWGLPSTGGVRAGVGAGVGIFYDVLRVDLLRGIGPGGRWEVVLDANRAFWGFL
jgi:hypothetical protein